MLTNPLRFPLIRSSSLISLALFGAACGSDEDGTAAADAAIVASDAIASPDAVPEASADAGPLQTTSIDDWRSYCIATATESFDVLMYTGDVFTAQAGNEFLLAEYDEPKDIEASMFHLGEEGALPLEVEQADFPEGFPLTSNCTPDATVRHYAALTDATVYTSAALSTVLCEIPAGTVVPGGGGYEAIGIPTTGQDATYKLFLRGYEAQCGAAEGYVNAPAGVVRGVATHTIPLRVIAGSE